jgi:hypothetical protein
MKLKFAFWRLLPRWACWLAGLLARINDTHPILLLNFVVEREREVKKIKIYFIRERLSYF